MNQPWTTEFETVVKSHLPWLDPNEALEPHQSLADQGLDSLATVSVLLDLEDTFSVRIPDELLTAFRFDTAASIWDLLQHAINMSVDSQNGLGAPNSPPSAADGNS